MPTELRHKLRSAAALLFIERCHSAVTGPFASRITFGERRRGLQPAAYKMGGFAQRKWAVPPMWGAALARILAIDPAFAGAGRVALARSARRSPLPSR